MTVLLFAGDYYYPEGGALDLMGRFESADQAMQAHDPQRFECKGGWANVLDEKTLVIVKSFSRGVWKDGPVVAFAGAD